MGLCLHANQATDRLTSGEHVRTQAYFLVFFFYPRLHTHTHSRLRSSPLTCWSHIFRTPVMEPAPNACPIYRVQHLFLGALFLALGSSLFAFEPRRPTPYYTGYWNGILGMFAGLSLLATAAKPCHWLFLLTAFSNALTIVGSVTAILSSLGPHSGRTQPTYWICLCMLAGSIYSLIIVLLQQGMCSTNGGVPEGSNLPLPENRSICVPPEDFILPTEVPCLPEYDTLSEPPSYNDIANANKGNCNNSSARTDQ